MLRKSLCGVIVIVLAILLSGGLLEAATIGKDAEGRPTKNGVPFFPRMVFDSFGNWSGWTGYLQDHGVVDLAGAINIYMHMTSGTGNHHIDLANALEAHGIMVMAVGNAHAGGSVDANGAENSLRIVLDGDYRRNQWETHPNAAAVYLADEPEAQLLDNVAEWHQRYKQDMPGKATYTVLLHGLHRTADARFDYLRWSSRQIGDWVGADPYPVGVGSSSWRESNGWPHWWTAEHTGVVRSLLPGRITMTALQLNYFTGDRFPTTDELWTHMVMALVEGAKGLSWWALGLQGWATDQYPEGLTTAVVPGERERVRDDLKAMGLFIRDFEQTILSAPQPAKLAGNSTDEGNPVQRRLNWLNTVIARNYNGLTLGQLWFGGALLPLEEERSRLQQSPPNTSQSWMLDQASKVRTRVWEMPDGTGLVLAYNHEIDPVAATFTWYRDLARVEVIGNEVREIPVNSDGRSWTDDFGGSHTSFQGPANVHHIYRLIPAGTAPPPPPGPLTVAFTNPANGATVGGTITVSLAASGGTGNFTQYRVAVDGTTIFTGASSAFSWNTTSVANGAHTLTGTVTDSAGTTASTSISVTVQQPSGGPPLSVAFTNPTQGQVVSGTRAIDIWVENAVGSSNTFVTKVDGVTIDTRTIPGAHANIWPWNTTTLSDGTHTLSATVTDAAGRTATTSITVTVSNGAPLSVSFTNPTQGQVVSGTRAIDIWVSNAIGASNTFVTKVDGVTIDTQTISGAHANIWPWNTTTLSDGTHTLSAAVTDSAGRTATTSITVTVSNGPPLSASFTNPTQGQTVSGTRAIDVWVSNAIGSSNTFVTKVDGVTINTQTISGTHANIWPWNTTVLSNGSHTLSATVTDSVGRTATTSITVTVSNP